MKRTYFICLFLCSTNVLLMSQSDPVPLINRTPIVSSPFSAPQLGPKTQAKILDGYGKLPLSFEANQGQADAAVKFVSRTSSYSIFLTADEAILNLRGSQKGKVKGSRGDANFRPGMIAAMAVPTSDPAPGRTTDAVLRMKLRNANPATKVTGADQLPGTSNYFIGSDSAKWHSNVPTYAKVKYEGIYPGIDLVYYGNQQQLEYDFIVAPGVDPRSIQFDVRGAKRIRQDQHGDLVLKVGEGEIRWHKPVVYQEKDGARQLVAAHYAITDKNRVGFEIGGYDASRPLYIDPLIYSIYLGGLCFNCGAPMGLGITVDSVGNAYVTGYTPAGFPTINPLQATFGGGYVDAFVAKINPTGTALVYSTYLGGSGDDYGYGIAIDSAGSAYIVGETSSADFPTKNPLQATFGGGYSDAFVAKISPTGTALTYSTYLGGSARDRGTGIAVDSVGRAYIVGLTYSADFPTKNPLQAVFGGDGDAFVAKINSTGTALVYSTYLGGSGFEYGAGIAVDSVGRAYIIGNTSSAHFPTKNPLQATFGGGYTDAFVAKINSSGSGLIYSTYLGGSADDRGVGIAVDSAGNAYVTGPTYSPDFPTTPGAFQTIFNGGSSPPGVGDSYVTKLNSSGSDLIYSTYLGGSAGELSAGIAIDNAGNAYVTGHTSSNDFPTTPGAFETVCDSVSNTLTPGSSMRCARHGDSFVTRLNSSGSALVYSTYLGGTFGSQASSIAADSAGNAYVTGYGFPMKNPWQAGYFGAASVTKIDERAVVTAKLSSSANPSAYGQAVTFTAVLDSNLGEPPNGETVLFEKGMNVLGTGILSGGSASFTTSALGRPILTTSKRCTEVTLCSAQAHRT